MAKPVKENTKNVFYYVRDHSDENITATDIADALGLSSKTVNGIVTAAGTKKEPPLMARIPAELELADGTHKGVKFITLTAEGEDYAAKLESGEIE